MFFLTTFAYEMPQNLNQSLLQLLLSLTTVNFFNSNSNNLTVNSNNFYTLIIAIRFRFWTISAIFKRMGELFPIIKASTTDM